MNDYRAMEKVATQKAARETVGRPHPWTSNADLMATALMRYLAAEEYHEYVEETREAEDATDVSASESQAPDQSR